MHLTILTGASRGLGAAMAEQLLKNGHRLLTLSRHTADLWVVQGSDLEQWSVDLIDPACRPCPGGGNLHLIDCTRTSAP